MRFLCDAASALLSYHRPWADKTRTSCPSTSCYSGPFCVPSARGKARVGTGGGGRKGGTAFSQGLSSNNSNTLLAPLAVFTGGGRHTEPLSDGAARHLSACALAQLACRDLSCFFFPEHLKPLRKGESQLQQHDLLHPEKT